MVACKKDFNYIDAMKNKKRLKVATKYTNAASEFFAKKAFTSI